MCVSGATASWCYPVGMAAKRKSNPISEYLSNLGRKGGQAGTGASKARSPEQAKKANAASHEAKRRKRAKAAGETPPPPED